MQIAQHAAKPSLAVCESVSTDFAHEASPSGDSQSQVFVVEPSRPFELDSAALLDPWGFPNPPRKGTSGPSATIPNVLHLLSAYNITVRYDVIKKRNHITMPGQHGTVENAANVGMTQILSLATLNGMNTSQIPAIVESLADRNLYNPVAEWIMSKPWDMEDREEAFYETLQERDDFPQELKKVLMRRWLLSAVAAALSTNGFHTRGVLTLQGPQGIGKTAWTRALISDPALSRQVIKVDHQIDGNKDSLIGAVEHFIVELGELEGSFRKDVARLKGFLTADQDKVRRPYARFESEYPRRTVFCATVNDDNFLVDSTGNTRFWTLPLVGINHRHDIDMQQVFAQFVEIWKGGEQHWLTDQEEEWLEQENRKHLAVSAIRDRLQAYLANAKIDGRNNPALSATQVLKVIGIDNPTNPQSRECGTALRELLGEPKRIQGCVKWRFPTLEFQDPLNAQPATTGMTFSEDDF